VAASEALSVPAESTAAAVDPEAALEASAVPKSSAAPQFRTQLVPIAQLVAIVLGVFAIIWNQQQSIDSLRTELGAEILRVESELRAEILRLETGLRAEISRVESGLRAEILRLETGLRAEISGVESGLGAEIGGLRADVAENGQRLARIEGFLGIGAPDADATARPG